MSKKSLLGGQTIERLEDGVFVLHIEPYPLEVWEKVRGDVFKENLIREMEKPLTLEGDLLRTWLEMYSINLRTAEFIDLCEFLELDPASFGKLSEWFNIYK